MVDAARATGEREEGQMSRVSLGRRVAAARTRAYVLMLAGSLASLTLVFTPAAQASLPEVGRCVKVATGTGAYTSGKCITRETGSRGKWEFVPASATEDLTFSGGGVQVQLATAGHEEIGCVVANVKGTFAGPKSASAEIELQGCTNAKGESCGSATNENQIKFNPLEAELGFIQNIVIEGRLHVKVGMDFKPQTPQTSLASYKCGINNQSELPTAAIEGSVIATDKPIDVMKEENKLIFHVKMGAQDPESFQEAAKDTLFTTITSGLESFGPFATTLGVKEYTGKYSQPLEIKAIEK
jgi:hypothetical protein